MHDGEPALGAPEIQSRAQTFASLRSAQRALRGLVQPVELERTLEHGRALLRRLRELGQGADDDPLPAGALEDADALLDGIAEQTRRLLGSVSLQELRSQLPRVAREEPSSILALARLVLGGDVESDPTLRVFEYLITMLCCEERDGDKVVCRSPAAVLPELAQLSARWVEAGDPRCLQARETLESAAAELAESCADEADAWQRLRLYYARIGDDEGQVLAGERHLRLKHQ